MGVTNKKKKKILWDKFQTCGTLLLQIHWEEVTMESHKKKSLNQFHCVHNSRLIGEFSFVINFTNYKIFSTWVFSLKKMGTWNFLDFPNL